MTMARFGRKLAVLAVVSTIGMMPLAARAQHVVTEDEAGKLTLEALTAAPRPVYRPIYRSAYFRQVSGFRYERRTHGWQRPAHVTYAVSRVSYRYRHRR